MKAAIIAFFLVPVWLSANSPSFAARAPSPPPWKTPARLRRSFGRERGVLEIGPREVIFHSAKGGTAEWTFADIQTFYITPHKLTITSYENRGWRLPGTKVYRFDLSRAVPSSVAAELADGVRKPSRNADPIPGQTGYALIPARHAAFTAGSNGVLRFTARGIEYITRSSGDSRAWRWADIQTIARPSLYEFTVEGFRETYRFELKQPMSQSLFDRLWNSVYGGGLEIAAGRQTKEEQ